MHTHLSPHNMTSEILWSNIFHPLTVDLEIYLPFSLFLPFQNHPISLPVVHTDKVLLDLLEQQGPICCGCVFVISSLAHIHTDQTEKGIHNRRNKALSTYKRCSSDCLCIQNGTVFRTITHELTKIMLRSLNSSWVHSVQRLKNDVDPLESNQSVQVIKYSETLTPPPHCSIILKHYLHI